MKLNQLKSNSTTSVELLLPDGTNEPTGVILTGYTPDSKEWNQIRKEVFGKNNKAEIIIGKKQQKMEIDPADAERQRRVLCKSITNITGIDDFTFKPEEAEAFLLDPEHNWMLDQWSEHIDSRENFFGKTGKPAKSGSKT